MGEIWSAFEADRSFSRFRFSRYKRLEVRVKKNQAARGFFGMQESQNDIHTTGETSEPLFCKFELKRVVGWKVV